MQLNRDPSIPNFSTETLRRVDLLIVSQLETYKRLHIQGCNCAFRKKILRYIENIKTNIEKNLNLK